jgi:hypothetical protein
MQSDVVFVVTWDGPGHGGDDLAGAGVPVGSPRYFERRASTV